MRPPGGGADGLVLLLLMALQGVSALIMPTVVLDNMLPGQTLKLRSDDDAWCEFIQEAAASKQEVGVVGIEPGSGRIMRRGVVASVICEEVSEASNRPVRSVWSNKMVSSISLAYSRFTAFLIRRW